MYVYTGRCRPVSSNVVRSVNTAYDYAWRLIQASGRILKQSLSYSLPCLVSINVYVGPGRWMGDRLRAGKSSRYLASRLGKLSLPSLRGR